jgi:hypothetical protein
LYHKYQNLTIITLFAQTVIQVAIKSISRDLDENARHCLEAALPEGFALAPSTANNIKGQPAPACPPKGLKAGTNVNMAETETTSG